MSCVEGQPPAPGIKFNDAWWNLCRGQQTKRRQPKGKGHSNAAAANNLRLKACPGRYDGAQSACVRCRAVWKSWATPLGRAACACAPTFACTPTFATCPAHSVVPVIHQLFRLCSWWRLRQPHPFDVLSCQHVALKDGSRTLWLVRASFPSGARCLSRRGRSKYNSVTAREKCSAALAPSPPKHDETSMSRAAQFGSCLRCAHPIGPLCLT